MAKYINPFTDFGFKKIFGEESSKNILLDFINALLPGLHIKNLIFKKSEQLPSTAASRKAIFDIYCENENGEKFIVELQKARQNFFKERMLYYSTHPITEQVETNNYKFNLKAVYCIGILDFKFNDSRKATVNNEVLHTAMLKDQNGEPFYEKLTYIYIEMPRFDRLETELATRQDKWLYFIKKLDTLEDIPKIFNGDALFMEAFKKAELAALTRDEHFSYADSVIALNDWHAILDAAVEDAESKAEIKAENEKERALKEAKIEAIIEKEKAVKETELKAEQEKKQAIKETELKLAKSLKRSGVPIDVLSNATGIPIEEIGLM